MGSVLRLERSAGKNNGVDAWRRVTFAAVEKVIEGLQANLNSKDLEQISTHLLEHGQLITGALLQEVLKTRGASEIDRTQYPCPGCGDILCKKGDKSRDIETRHGKVSVERPYFYCDGCEDGYFPFDEAIGLAPQKKQYDLQRAATRLLSQLPYEEAASPHAFCVNLCQDLKILPNTV